MYLGTDAREQGKTLGSNDRLVLGLHWGAAELAALSPGTHISQKAKAKAKTWRLATASLSLTTKPWSPVSCANELSKQPVSCPVYSRLPPIGLAGGEDAAP